MTMTRWSVQLASAMTASGGADLDLGAKAHEPGSEGKQGIDAGAEGDEGVSIDLLEELVGLEPFDAAPLVTGGDARTEPAGRRGAGSRGGASQRGARMACRPRAQRPSARRISMAAASTLATSSRIERTYASGGLALEPSVTMAPTHIVFSQVSRYDRGGVLGRIAVVVSLALWVGEFLAHAQGAEHAFGEGMRDAAVLAVPLLLAPSNIGPEVRLPRGQGVADFRFVLGWAMQFPLPLGRGPTKMHRLTLAPELAIGTSDHAIFRFRGGYRFGWRMLVAGLSIGGDRTSAFVSPELGIRIPRAPDEFALGALLTARCDLEPKDGTVRLSMMLGWVAL